jgi:V/A-type H+-transporting ATPase subunit E
MSSKHGISAIANEVICDIQREAIALITEAQVAAKETLERAKQEADENYQAILNQAYLKINVEKRRIASLTEVEMRNYLLQTKENLVDLAFKKALSSLLEFAKSEKYRDYLFRLIEISAKKINQQNLVVRVNSRDKHWLTEGILKDLSEKLNVNLKLSEDTADFVGGCKVQTSDGKIIYDSTIDSRLQELKPVLRVEVAKMLFGANV